MRSESRIVRDVRDIYTHRGRSLEDLLEGRAISNAALDRLLAPFRSPEQRWPVPLHHGRPFVLVNLGYWAEATDWAAAQIAFTRFLADQAGDLAGARVLDAGSGLAGAGIILADDYGARVDCLNVVEQQVRWSRDVIAMHGLQDRVWAHLGSACDMPFPDASFDVVFCLEAAHFFPRKDRFLAEVRRVLHPGGRLVMADVVSTSGNFFLSWEWLARLQLITWSDWRRLMAAAGLTLVKEASIAPAVFPGLLRWIEEEHARSRGMLKRGLQQAWSEATGWGRLARLARVPWRSMQLTPALFRRVSGKLLWTRDVVLFVATR
jgi:cyclopropane fatty-acyl-phospholipid synthase-like methyltransferase